MSYAVRCLFLTQIYHFFNFNQVILKPSTKLFESVKYHKTTRLTEFMLNQPNFIKLATLKLQIKTSFPHAHELQTLPVCLRDHKLRESDFLNSADSCNGKALRYLQSIQMLVGGLKPESYNKF